MDQNCITFPRQIQTIEAFQICTTPGIVRNGWFEFLGNGRGAPGSCGGGNLFPMGDMYCTYSDIVPGAKKIRIYPLNGVDATPGSGKTILLQGYDDNSDWILTDGGATEGERLTLIMPYVESTKFFSALVSVQKQRSAGYVRVFEKDTTLADPLGLRDIALWAPDETAPQYLRSLIPGLSGSGSCCSNTTTEEDSETVCNKTKVTVMAKARFIPVLNDTDWLQIGSMAALQEMILSVARREQGPAYFADSEAHEQRAVRLLEEELLNYIGHGTVSPFRVEDSSTFGAGAIQNVVSSWGSGWGGYW